MTSLFQCFRVSVAIVTAEQFSSCLRGNSSPAKLTEIFKFLLVLFLRHGKNIQLPAAVQFL